MNQTRKISKISVPQSHIQEQILHSMTARKALNHFCTSIKSNPSKFCYETNLDPLDIITEFCNYAKTKTNIEALYSYFHLTATKLGYSFVGMALPDSEKEYLNIRLTDHNGNVYIDKQSLNEENEYIVQSFKEKTRRLTNNFEFMNIHSLKDNQCSIMPLALQEESLGVIIAGSKSRNIQNDALLHTLCNYLALLIENFKLKEKITTNNDFDSLTSMYTHRKFHELLSLELSKADNYQSNVSLIMFDLNNISKINKEFGHAKGDEIISKVAEIIKENIRKIDITGRYGGDEIAIILPETTNKDACKIAKTINRNLSCCCIDKVGFVKVSTGLSTYPIAADKEQLLILAEQAMLISKHNSYKKGKAVVVNSQNVNFWNETALNSLANTIARRNSKISSKFEEELVKKIQSKNKDIKLPIEIVTSLAGAIDAKDTYTRGHSQEVSIYSEALARTLNLSEEKVAKIKLAALLHDVGKIGISEVILRKPGALTDREWEVMKQHPIIGAKKVLEPIKSLKELIPIVKHHHERIDGHGYPDALKGAEIPIGARIVAIADAFHALISHRPYRKALHLDKALSILKSGAGTQWDKELVRKFIEIAPSLHKKQ